MRPKSNQEKQMEMGMLITLVCLTSGFYFQRHDFFKVAFCILAATLVLPIIWRPIVGFWLKLGEFLGKATSIVLLLVIYGLLVIPIAIFRKILKGNRILSQNLFKDKDKTGWIERKYLFVPSDLQHPF